MSDGLRQAFACSNSMKENSDMNETTATVYVCNNDSYSQETEVYDSVEEFREMLTECFGVAAAKELTSNGDDYLAPDGNVALHSVQIIVRNPEPTALDVLDGVDVDVVVTIGAVTTEGDVLLRPAEDGRHVLEAGGKEPTHWVSGALLAALQAMGGACSQLLDIIEDMAQEVAGPLPTERQYRVEHREVGSTTTTVIRARNLDAAEQRYLAGPWRRADYESEPGDLEEGDTITFSYTIVGHDGRRVGDATMELT